MVVRTGPVTEPTATILLHGAAGSWSTWTPLLAAAQRSGEPLRNVIAIDLPGWGESPAPASGIPIARMGEAVGEVARRLGYDRWIVIGHSLGGFLALDIAARFRVETEAVLAISPSGRGILDAVRRPIRGGFGLPGFSGMLLAMRALSGLGPATRPLLRGLNRVGMLRVLAAPLFAEPAYAHPSVVDALVEEIRPRAFVGAARAAAHYDETAWARIACRVRTVRGERDVFVADSDEAALEALVPKVDQATIRGAGHFAAIEQPDEILRVLREATASAATAEVRR